MNSSNTNPSAVAVIDDDSDIRSSLSCLLASIGLSAIAYRSAEDFLQDDPASASCVVTDMRMPGMSGLQLQQEMLARRLLAPLIFLTGYADVSAAVRSMKAGAFDFIEKPCSPQLLLETVHEAVKHSQTTRKQQDQTTSVCDRFNTLTLREKQVMRLVTAGHPNKLIAKQLKLSEKTIEFHRARVMKKMLAENMAELVRLGMSLPAPSPAEHLPSGPIYRQLGNPPTK